MSWNDDYDPDEAFNIRGEFLRSTANAMLIRLEDDSEEWFPFSQMTSYPIDPDRGDEIEITIPLWLAVKKELAEP